MKRKYVVCTFAAALILFVGILSQRPSDRATMQWAKTLSVSEVSKIEMTVLLSTPENERYHLFDESEFADIISLINDCNGRYVSNPESLCGGGTILYVTTQDGIVHTVINHSAVYLVIDGDTYSASGNWLSGWWDAYELDRGTASVPNPPPDYLEY